MNRRHILGLSLIATLGLSLVPFAARAADDELAGTYKLISRSRVLVDSGQVETFDQAQGFITYGNDGRVLVLGGEYSSAGSWTSTSQNRAETMCDLDRNRKADSCGRESAFRRGYGALWLFRIEPAAPSFNRFSKILARDRFERIKGGGRYANVLICQKGNQAGGSSSIVL